MKITSLLVFASALAAGVANAGDISGTVTLSGTPPPEKAITPLKEDATCGKFHPETPMTSFYVVGANKELADVIVMLKGVTGKSTGAAAAPAVIDQKGCFYIPQILAVQTGQKIMVKNSDPVLHNVHANPADGWQQGEEQRESGPDGRRARPGLLPFLHPENFLKFNATCIRGCSPGSRWWIIPISRSPARTASSRSRMSPPANTSRGAAPQSRADGVDTGNRSHRCRREGGLHARSEVVGSFWANRCGGARSGFFFAVTSQRRCMLRSPMLTLVCTGFAACLTALATLGLVGVGGLVTSHGVGMSVPDWPTSYGYNMFALPVSVWLTGGVFYEHTHRLWASLVGVLVVALTRWLGGRRAVCR